MYYLMRMTEHQCIREIRVRTIRGSPSGLSLLETTIAIGVIVTGLFAAFTLVIANRRTSDEAGLRFAAVQLAREGVEIVRATRDSNWISEDAPDWDEGLKGSAGSYTGVAVFNPGMTSWQLTFGAATFSDPSARVVRQQDGNGETFWTQGQSGDAAVDLTPYRRLIDVHPICADGQVAESGCADANPKVGMRVRSRVQWTSRGITHAVTAEESMFNWR